MPRDPRDVLPLKPEVFDILLILCEGHRHGWSLVRELRTRRGSAPLPGNFYRLLRGLTALGLIDVAQPSRLEQVRAAADTGANAERRRYFRLTPFGRDVARAEARRLEQLVAQSRERRLLSPRVRG